MKKLFLLATLFAAIVTTSVSAQGGPGGGMTPEQMAERQKQLKADLVAKAKITEAEAEKVMEIRKESRGNWGGMKDMSPEERQKKMEEMKAERNKKLKAIPLTDEQVKAVETVLDEQMKKGPGRPGGNGSGNN